MKNIICGIIGIIGGFIANAFGGWSARYVRWQQMKEMLKTG